MAKIYYNGMDRKAVAANNNINTENNFNTNNTIADAIKAMLIAEHDGAKDYGSGENGMDFNFSYGDYRIFVVRSYGVWHFNIYKAWRSAGDYDAKLTEQWGGYRMGSRRWSNSLIMDMSVAMAQIINSYESMETPMEKTAENTAEMNSTLGSDEALDSEDESDAIAEQMSEVVAEYQIKVDEQMETLYAVADSFDKIKYRISYAKAASVVRRIEKLSWDCLQDCGKISGCEMVPDDGYCPNIDALIKWADGVLIDDLEETLDYMAVYEDRVAPISTDMAECLDSEWGYDYVMAPMTEDEAIKWYSLNYEDIKAMADERKIELYALAF